MDLGRFYFVRLCDSQAPPLAARRQRSGGPEMRSTSATTARARAAPQTGEESFSSDPCVSTRYRGAVPRRKRCAEPKKPVPVRQDEDEDEFAPIGWWGASNASVVEEPVVLEPVGLFWRCDDDASCDKDNANDRDCDNDDSSRSPPSAARPPEPPPVPRWLSASFTDLDFHEFPFLF